MLSNILQVLGVVAVTVGVLLFSVPAGLIVGGLLVILMGVTVSK